jgi:hypothetical protein
MKAMYPLDLRLVILKFSTLVSRDCLACRSRSRGKKKREKKSPILNRKKKNPNPNPSGAQTKKRTVRWKAYSGPFPRRRDRRRVRQKGPTEPPASRPSVVPRTAGHHREAARRRRAQPRASTRAGEGACGSAVFLSFSGRHGRCCISHLVRRSLVREKGKKEMEIRVWGERRPGFLLPESEGRPSDLDERLRAAEPDMTQAGRRFPSPGRGCSLGAGRAQA